LNDLFSPGVVPGSGESQSPLADRMRPRVLEDIIGQDHIVGPGRLLRRAIQADRLSSLIFYGPPGTGKTSIARVIANTTRAAFESLNAVLSGVKNIREAIDRADERFRLYSKRTILFVDEVHRWNKAQQDALLPWVENGTVILVGATTENPFFEVNRALVSRSRIFQLKPLDAKGLMKTARNAIADAERGYGKWRISFEDGALEHLVEVSGGDARSLLNALELAIETSSWSLPEGETPTRISEADARWPPPEGTAIHISLESAEESIQRRAVLYDRDGDYHFDTISAFIKSVRGSDPDAALYWLAKMLRAGEDPSFIFRRMIILASEDIGLADPHALSVVISCAEAFDRIGFPEGNFPLAHACLYLATSPKSNTTLSLFDAMKEVDKEDAEVPNHLRDASRDAESFGHGEGYIYPHAYRDHWAAQQYLPNALRGRAFYIPSPIGYEGKIRDEVLRKRELQAAVILGDLQSPGDQTSDGELLSWSAAAKGREGWFKRLESGRSALLLSDRDAVFNAASPARQDRILIPLAADGLFLWESLRRCPEGLSAALVANEAGREALFRYAAVLDQIEQPEIAVLESGLLPSPQQAAEWFSSNVFDLILIREPWRRGFAGTQGNRPQSPEAEFLNLAESAKALLAPEGRIVLLCSPPMTGQRISQFIIDEDQLLAEKLIEAEDAFFSLQQGKLSAWNWDAAGLSASFESQGFKVKIDILEQKEERLIGPKDIQAWFDKANSRWGVFMGKALGTGDFSRAEEILTRRIQSGPLPWKWKSLLLTIGSRDLGEGRCGQ
jgi:putative ATPase